MRERIDQAQLEGRPTEAVPMPPTEPQPPLVPEPGPVPSDPPGPVIVPEPEPVPSDPPGPVIVPEPEPVPHEPPGPVIVPEQLQPVATRAPPFGSRTHRTSEQAQLILACSSVLSVSRTRT
jgi:hypothetical protein